MFFRSGSPAIDNYDFLKRFGTLYDFLIDLLSEIMDIIKATKEQSEIIKKINKLGSFVLLEEESIYKEKSSGVVKKAKTKMQRKKIISSQKSVINNAVKLHDKEVLLLMRLYIEISCLEIWKMFTKTRI